MDSFGFIITRHVNSETTNKYWNHSIKLLKTLYPNRKIIIIDDNSNQNYVKSEFDYKNIEIIKSEFKGAGEILPYYYFLKNKYFENAVILHDSVFFHKRIPFELLNHNVVPLWYFNPDKENVENSLRIVQQLKNNYIIQKKITHNDNVIGLPQDKWFGCFGSQSYINHNFLLKINEKYGIVNLTQSIKNRSDRCCLERIIGCIFFTENAKLCKVKALFGDIMSYQKWGESTFDKYIENFNKGNVKKSVVKVWTGR